MIPAEQDAQPCPLHKLGFIGADCTCPKKPATKVEQLSLVMALPPWLSIEQLWDETNTAGQAFRALAAHHANSRAGHVNGFAGAYELTEVDPDEDPIFNDSQTYVRFVFDVTMPADTILTNEKAE